MPPDLLAPNPSSERQVRWTLAVEGDLDPQAARAMKRRMTRLGDIGPGVVTLDLGAVDAIDAVAVGALLDADARLRMAGSRVEIVLPRGSARFVLELLGARGRLTFTGGS